MLETSVIKFLNSNKVVYKVQCKNCEKSYTGFTSQCVKARFHQHKTSFKLKSKVNTGLSTHAIFLHHDFNFDNCETKLKINQEK